MIGLSSPGYYPTGKDCATCKVGCPICDHITKTEEALVKPVIKTNRLVKNLLDDSIFAIDSELYDGIEKAVKTLIDKAEKSGDFLFQCTLNGEGGFAFENFTLKNGKQVTLSIRKTVIDGKPNYEFMVYKQ